MRTGIFFIILLSSISCCGQAGWTWSVFESKNAGIRVSLPCTPKESDKTFQDQPRPIHVYEFSCEVDGVRFLLSVKNHQNSFTSRTVDESFESNEFILKNMFGAIGKFDVRKDFTTNEFASQTVAKFGA